jgi:hypothetical protein
MNNLEEQLSNIPPGERVLLLSHCMRPSQTCPGKYSKQGLECPDDCQEVCSIGSLRRAALKLGYKGICIAPGGRMALKFVKENNPRGIVAVACNKELEEGIEAVRELGAEDMMPPIVPVPLTADGCVDTVVDEKYALEIISLGCTKEMSAGKPASG